MLSPLLCDVKGASLLQRTASPGLLASYEAERWPVAVGNTHLRVANFESALAVPRALGLEPYAARCVRLYPVIGGGVERCPVAVGNTHWRGGDPCLPASLPCTFPIFLLSFPSFNSSPHFPSLPLTPAHSPYSPHSSRHLNRLFPFVPPSQISFHPFLSPPPSLFSAALSSSTANQFLPRQLQTTLIEAGLSAGRQLLLSDWLLSPANPVGRERLAVVQRSLEEGKSLQLLFPQHDLGFRWGWVEVGGDGWGWVGMCGDLWGCMGMGGDVWGWVWMDGDGYKKGTLSLSPSDVHEAAAYESQALLPIPLHPFPLSLISVHCRAPHRYKKGALSLSLSDAHAAAPYDSQAHAATSTSFSPSTLPDIPFSFLPIHPFRYKKGALRLASSDAHEVAAYDSQAHAASSTSFTPSTLPGARLPHRTLTLLLPSAASASDHQSGLEFQPVSTPSQWLVSCFHACHSCTIPPSTTSPFLPVSKLLPSSLSPLIPLSPHPSLPSSLSPLIPLSPHPSLPSSLSPLIPLAQPQGPSLSSIDLSHSGSITPTLLLHLFFVTHFDRSSFSLIPPPIPPDLARPFPLFHQHLPSRLSQPHPPTLSPHLSPHLADMALPPPPAISFPWAPSTPLSSSLAIPSYTHCRCSIYSPTPSPHPSPPGRALLSPPSTSPLSAPSPPLSSSLSGPTLPSGSPPLSALTPSLASPSASPFSPPTPPPSPLSLLSSPLSHQHCGIVCRGEATGMGRAANTAGGKGEWLEWLAGVGDSGAVLVRPDGHVAWRMMHPPAAETGSGADGFGSSGNGTGSGAVGNGTGADGIRSGADGIGSGAAESCDGVLSHETMSEAAGAIAGALRCVFGWED
ncbi:unnamed protein product [Closterium sp. Naga37s-1]|nr:unnamed protein product [Closterium sp. Naga37s-1]